MLFITENIQIFNLIYGPAIFAVSVAQATTISCRQKLPEHVEKNAWKSKSKSRQRLNNRLVLCWVLNTYQTLPTAGDAETLSNHVEWMKPFSKIVYENLHLIHHCTIEYDHLHAQCHKRHPIGIWTIHPCIGQNEWIHICNLHARNVIMCSLGNLHAWALNTITSTSTSTRLWVAQAAEHNKHSLVLASAIKLKKKKLAPIIATDWSKFSVCPNNANSFLDFLQIHSHANWYVPRMVLFAMNSKN